MKKLISVILCIACIAALSACSGSQSISNESKSTESAASTESTSADGIDLDLTSMSSTMVFSEVQNMMLAPENYIGKSVKMTGTLNVTEYNGNRYFACIISDATACCANGIEFDRKGEYTYPDDYPEQGSQVTVTGEFTTYIEDKKTYCQLKDADVQF